MDIFTPLANASTASLTAATTTANVQIPLPAAGETYNITVEIFNASTETVFVAFGTSNAVTATLATGYPVGAGLTKRVGVPVGTLTSGVVWTTLWGAAIGAAAASAPIYFTAGLGVT